MRKARPTNRGRRRRAGLTLLELLMGSIVALLLFICVGILMADSQKNYERIFSRVAGDRTTDGQAAIQAFDSLCRQASRRRCLLSVSEEMLEVYLYSDPQVSFPDRFACFYASGTDLLLEQGALQPGTWARGGGATETIVLARELEEVRFRKEGEALQMFLTFQNPQNPGMVVCSSIRQSE